MLQRCKDMTYSRRKAKTEGKEEKIKKVKSLRYTLAYNLLQRCSCSVSHQHQHSTSAWYRIIYQVKSFVSIYHHGGNDDISLRISSVFIFIWFDRIITHACWNQIEYNGRIVIQNSKLKLKDRVGSAWWYLARKSFVKRKENWMKWNKK